MPQNGLLIEYEYCTGCHSCEVACKQEHDYPAGPGGITVGEYVTKIQDRVYVDYVPVLTRLCDLCAERTGRGELPACVKHCQSICMMYGDIADLAKTMKSKPRSVIFAPR